MSDFQLNYTGREINDLLAKADTSIQQSDLEAYHDDSKQDVINDLATIRSGAELGATALQSVPDTYATKTYVTSQGYVTSDYHDNTKQDVIDDLATIRTNAGKGATAVQPNALLEKSTEQWQFTLADGSTVTKKIVLGE